MDVVDFVLNLAKNNSPATDNDFAEIKKEANAWKETATVDDSNLLKKTFAKYGRLWYVRALCMILWAPAMRAIYEYMNAPIESEEEEERY